MSAIQRETEDGVQVGRLTMRRNDEIDGFPSSPAEAFRREGEQLGGTQTTTAPISKNPRSATRSFTRFPEGPSWGLRAWNACNCRFRSS